MPQRFVVSSFTLFTDHSVSIKVFSAIAVCSSPNISPIIALVIPTVLTSEREIITKYQLNYYNPADRPIKVTDPYAH